VPNLPPPHEEGYRNGFVIRNLALTTADVLSWSAAWRAILSEEKIVRDEKKNIQKQILRVVLAASMLWFCTVHHTAGASDARRIDTARSKMIVHVLKSGFFSAFAHNHEIEAAIELGDVNESGGLSAQLRVDARKLHVLDPEASADTRAKIQETMLGPQVLDADRFPEIDFKSTAVEAKGRGRWLVRGDLDLHGQTHPVAVDVTRKDDVYRGTAVVKQTEFGIKPVSIAGGTVNVKDEVKIEFEIVLSRSENGIARRAPQRKTLPILSAVRPPRL
jgi:hypothetical protein